MKNIRLLIVGIGAFVGGVAFVLACGHGDTPIIDAGGRADAADCAACEAPITADRIYQVRDEASLIVGQPGAPDTSMVWSSASCNPGDILLGGGCFVRNTGALQWRDNRNNAHQLIDSGPMPPLNADPADPDAYHCLYSDNDNVGTLIVTATAICFHPVMPE
jgi:hypothetical protein